MSAPFNLDPTVTYAKATRIAPGVRRITCENPSPYTFTGTQSYLVGVGEVALIDPGPQDTAHLGAIMAALGPDERITHILVTHSHQDHSPGARLLAAETGAPVYAFGPHGSGMSETMQTFVETGAEIGGGEGGDDGFAPDHNLQDGARIEGGDWALSAIHTPGHLSNHLSYALETDDGGGIVFTGDMVMGFATTLVSPPEGDMTAFMASLDRLAMRSGDTMYLPGHGHQIDAPHAMLAHQKAHREQRFDQILAALQDGPRDAATLTREIYTEIDPRLLPAAQRNVLASLIGMSDDGRIAAPGGIAVDAVFRLA